MDKKDFYKQLIHRYATNEATKEELEAFFTLLESPEMDNELQAYLEKTANEDEQIIIRTHRRLWPRIAVAASLLLLLSVSAYFLTQPWTNKQSMAQNYKNDVTPGSNQATLTLGNGQVIVLNTKPNGNMAMQGNVAITKAANGQIKYQAPRESQGEVMFNTLTTKRKEQYKVILADGTNVWLNAESSIKYPTAFTGHDREVAITGEAYFEVAHDERKPFKVKAQNETVEVLGTHFNVNTYANEPSVKTTLLQGSVKVAAFSSFKIIKPGQEAVLNNDQLVVSDANTEVAVAWKNGYFLFNRENIGSIMRKLSRWYDIDVEFDVPVSKEEYSGRISRSRNISEILKVFEYSGSIHFKIEGRRVTVLK